MEKINEREGFKSITVPIKNTFDVRNIASRFFHVGFLCYNQYPISPFGGYFECKFDDNNDSNMKYFTRFKRTSNVMFFLNVYHRDKVLTSYLTYTDS